MKKCKENKMATISMLQMVADYAKKDYISCSANKKHKNMKKLIFHVFEKNYVRSAFREILTFLSISPLHLHRVGRTCRSHFGRPVHPGMHKIVCMSELLQVHLFVLRGISLRHEHLIRFSNPIGANDVSGLTVVGLSAVLPSSCDQP